MPKQPAAQPWEYKLVSMGNPLEPDVELRASALGKQGWELVAIDAGVWIFKRPSTEEAPAGTLEAIIEETIPVTEPVSLPPPPPTCHPPAPLGRVRATLTARAASSGAGEVLAHRTC
jgi:hypothetical protein